MTKDNLTIIIPTYNSEKKIASCIGSLKKQTSKNFQIIFIDDNSQDNTVSLINKSLSDDNIKYTIINNKNNMGAGRSRNVGIAKANTEYITFVDSDDYVTDDFVEIIQETITKTNRPDCLCFDYYKKSKTRIEKCKSLRNCEPGKVKIKNALVFMRGATWAKVYKTSIIKKSKISFPDIQRKEDMVFTKIAISNCKTIQYINRHLYFYIMNEGSLMHNNELRDQNNSIIAMKLLIESLNNKYKAEIEYLFISECIYAMICTMIIKRYKRSIIKNTISEIIKDYDIHFDNIYMNRLEAHKKIILLLYKINCFTIIKVLLKIRDARND